jgi:hypothetical protein
VIWNSSSERLTAVPLTASHSTVLRHLDCYSNPLIE